MQYRDYGKTGMKTSLLGLGCMRLPRDENNAIDREKAYELIRYAATHGINYFDTALTYHNYNSEAVLGEALDGGLREKVYVVTKQPFPAMKTQADIRRNLEETLKKLRTDYLDVYLVHNINDAQWPEIVKRNILAEYEKFKSEGLIRHIAFSSHSKYKGYKTILDGYDWEMCQVQQNMLDVDKEATQQVILDGGAKGCAVVIMEPLRGGGLAGAPKVVQDIYDAAPVQRTPASWAFHHLANYPQISTILSGMTTLEQLKQNIETFSQSDMVPNSLDAAQLKVISDAKAAYESIVTVPCTGCEYCLPCPQSVAIPGVFSRYNEGMMFGSFDQPQRAYMLTTAAGRDAGKCVRCGACETKCPQHIAIMDQLAVAHDSLKGWIET